MRNTIYAFVAIALMVSLSFIPVIEGGIHQRNTCDERGEVTIEIYTTTGITTITKLMTKEEITQLQSILDNAQQELQALNNRDRALTRETLKEATSIILLTIEKLEKIEVSLISAYDEKDFIFQEGAWGNFYPTGSFPWKIVNLCCLVVGAGDGLKLTTVARILELILMGIAYRFPSFENIAILILGPLMGISMVRPRVFLPFSFWLFSNGGIETLGLMGHTYVRGSGRRPFSSHVGLIGFTGIWVTLLTPKTDLQNFCAGISLAVVR